MAKLFYINICGNEYKNEKNLNIIDFLNSETKNVASNKKRNF